MAFLALYFPGCQSIASVETTECIDMRLRCRFPDWRRVVPTGEETPAKDQPEDSAAHVHFNHAYVGDLAKMGKLLDGASMLHPVSASHPCLVTFGDRADCFAVLMPMRRKVDRFAVLTRNVVMAG